MIGGLCPRPESRESARVSAAASHCHPSLSLDPQSAPSYDREAAPCGPKPHRGGRPRTARGPWPRKRGLWYASAIVALASPRGLPHWVLLVSVPAGLHFRVQQNLAMHRIAASRELRPREIAGPFTHSMHRERKSPCLLSDDSAASGTTVSGRGAVWTIETARISY